MEAIIIINRVECCATEAVVVVVVAGRTPPVGMVATFATTTTTTTIATGELCVCVFCARTVYNLRDGQVLYH